MKKSRILFGLLILLVFCTCRKPYIAPVQVKSNQFLVVDGVINASPGGITRFSISYTRNLTDTTIQYPINDAFVRIEGEDGSINYLQVINDSGMYVSEPLNLSFSHKYRLLVQTKEQKGYSSDFVPILTAPEVDSITWTESPDLDFYLFTKDPSNVIQFYRWQFEETYQTRAQTPSFWTVVQGKIVEANESNQTGSCWITQSSTDILIGTTQSLSSAVINKAPLHKIGKPDKRLSFRYSLLLSQFAITPAAYQYYRIMKQNSEELGGIFDPMPSQLIGNIRSDSDPDEPVIGYISASQATYRRIFVENSELDNWPVIVSGYDCKVIYTGTNPVDYQIYDYPDPDYWPWYFSSGQPPGLVLSRKVCLDCRLSGGTNQKPLFW